MPATSPIVTCPRCGAKNRVDEIAAGRTTAVCGRCKSPLPPLSARTAGTAASSEPLIVTDGNFAEVVLGGSVPVLVDCWAPWCGPCRMMEPTINQLAAEAGGRYLVGKLNVDENPAVAARFNISSIPALLIFKEGRLVDQAVGVQPRPALAARIAAHL